MKSKITKAITMLSAVAILCSCSVQQFPVNTTTLPFAHGGTAFGEKTRGKEVKKAGEFFVFGINVDNADVKRMAEEIKATSYTIETKHNFLSIVINTFTFGILDYKVVKVIKREK